MNKRLTEASSWAGIGVIGHAVAMLIASHGVDPLAWAQLAAGTAAVLVPEKGTVIQAPAARKGKAAPGA